MGARKRKELQVFRLMAVLRREGGKEGIRLMLMPTQIDGVKLQVIWGLGARTTQCHVSSGGVFASAGSG